ncbi:MAG: hydrogenase formation protein HypD [Eubacterium sp.]|nr:hydrogenase formation protein HypD [Eubacterium sp.]
MDINNIIEKLKFYDGPKLRIMEICGSHTEAVSKYGIPSVISDRIKLLSGPGCPVCVTTSAYIDRLIELADEGNIIATFGDLIRVPGSVRALGDINDAGSRIKMLYSPLDIVPIAMENRETRFVFAAVGFETTMPLYALLMDELIEKNIKNVRLLTAIKTMPEVVGYMLENGAPVDAFLAPGHVSVVTGYGVFEPIARKYGVPFAVAGFSPERLLIAIYGLIKEMGNGSVKNYYPSVVNREGNLLARARTEKYFEKCDAVWRGLGNVAESGLRLKKEYKEYDAGSMGLDEDIKKNPACKCDRVLTGRLRPYECPLYGVVCTPKTPQGACMVSTEGSCYSYYVNKRTD